MANTWFEKKEQRKITYSIGGNETEIDFVLVYPLGVATSASNNRHRQKKVVGSS